MGCNCLGREFRMGLDILDYNIFIFFEIEADGK